MKYIFHSIFLLAILSANGQKSTAVNTNEFVTECMKTVGEAQNKQIALWFPAFFWQLIGDKMNNSPAFIQNLVDGMNDYIMFAVVDYTTSSSGISFKTEDEIRKSIRFVDSSNKIYMPLQDGEISQTAKDLMQSFQPIMGQVLGQFGEGMRIFLFPSKNINGKPVIDITKKYRFTLAWEKISMTWKLPLASLLPPRYCPVDNEKMKGDWNFCPEHGVSLTKKSK